jgi:predicted DNA-binding transcriptional regulator AlpA
VSIEINVQILIRFAIWEGNRMSSVQTGNPASVVQRGDRFLDVKETCKKVGVKSRNTLTALQKAQGFPSPIPVHARRVVYLESDVETWMAGVVARRDQTQAKETK